MYSTSTFHPRKHSMSLSATRTYCSIRSYKAHTWMRRERKGSFGIRERWTTRRNPLAHTHLHHPTKIGTLGNLSHKHKYVHTTSLKNSTSKFPDYQCISTNQNPLPSPPATSGTIHLHSIRVSMERTVHRVFTRTDSRLAWTFWITAALTNISFGCDYWCRLFVL